MSTSPSWFDQEKFSRLVKKVGPKNGPDVTGSLSHPPAVETTAPEPAPETSPENLASTARISLVSRPPSLLNEHRALPALPRRTAPLPGLKSIFKYPNAEPAAPVEPPIPAPVEAKTDAPPEPKPEVKTAILPRVQFEKEEKFEPIPAVEEIRLEPKFEFSAAPKFEYKPESMPETMDEPEPPTLGIGSEDDLDAIWQKMALLNEELAQTSRERDQAFHDTALLREQLEQAEEALEQKEKAEKTSSTPSAPGKTQELVTLTNERDVARKEYADLRKQFETLKREQNPSPRTESLKFRKELEQQLDGFRVKLEERNKEIAALKSAKAPSVALTGSIPSAEVVTSLREQLNKVREEASIAQRGLALSQKALHETRMTLREATEGTSLSRHNFDNLKAECAALTQQNTVLQAQNDQLTRELAATKSKLTTRL
jgi:hypothetical protein